MTKQGHKFGKVLMGDKGNAFVDWNEPSSSRAIVAAGFPWNIEGA
jgi:hypothetical protein